MIGVGLAIPELAGGVWGRGGTIARRFAAFPRLAAAFAAGRGLISIIGDSTTFGLGAGSGGFYGTSYGANAANPASALRAGLAAGGVTAIDGCAVVAMRNTTGSTQDAAAYYASGVIAAPSGWSNAKGRFGGGLATAWGDPAVDNYDGTSIAFEPGFAFDRADVFFTAIAGQTGYNGVRIGGSSIYTETTPAATIVRKSLSFAATTATLEAYNWGPGGSAAVCAFRAWNSAQPHVQVETLGNPSWRAADWADASAAWSPLNTIPLLGSDLFIVNLGLNDRHFGRTAAAFKADLKTIAAACRSTGADVLLVIPHAALNGSDYDLDADYVAAIGATAGELGLPAPVDLRAAGIAPADYYDDIHLLGPGYAKIGATYARQLLA